MKEQRFQELVEKIAREEGVKICDPSRIGKLAAALREEGVEIEEQRKLRVGEPRAWGIRLNQHGNGAKLLAGYISLLSFGPDGSVRAIGHVCPSETHPFRAAPGSEGRVAIEGYQWVGEGKEESEGEYVLRLTQEEGEILSELLMHVTGDHDGPRGKMGDVSMRLYRMGFKGLHRYVDHNGTHKVDLKPS